MIILIFYQHWCAPLKHKCSVLMIFQLVVQTFSLLLLNSNFLAFFWRNILSHQCFFWRSISSRDFYPTLLCPGQLSLWLVPRLLSAARPKSSFLFFYPLYNICKNPFYSYNNNNKSEEKCKAALGSSPGFCSQGFSGFSWALSGLSVSRIRLPWKLNCSMSQSHTPSSENEKNLSDFPKKISGIRLPRKLNSSMSPPQCPNHTHPPPLRIKMKNSPQNFQTKYLNDKKNVKLFSEVTLSLLHLARKCLSLR